MEIIERGKLPEEREFYGTCSHCKTKFKCKKKEGDFFEDQRDGPFLRVICPFCKHQAFAYPAR